MGGVCRKSSFLINPGSYSYAHKYSLSNHVVCAWPDARQEMVSKYRDDFMRLDEAQGSNHIMISWMYVTIQWIESDRLMSIEQWENSSYNLKG